MNTKKEKAGGNADLREQLVNEGAVGVIEQVSVPVSFITKINGILFDIDPYLFQPSSVIPEPSLPPNEFYERYVAKWLERHPVLQRAEVRLSGTGLHVLLWLDQPIELKDDLDRKRWAARVQVIQSVLPSDPNQPGINAMTRPVGSVNGKSNSEVKVLRKGSKVTEQELLDLVDGNLAAPFKQKLVIWGGDEKLDPCPICGKGPLASLDHVGRCYDCGTVKLDQLERAVFVAKKADKEVVNAA